MECAAELHDLVNDEVREFFPKLAGKYVARSPITALSRVWLGAREGGGKPHPNF